jgi:D-alanyl-D-alanine carboxypeptidase
MKNILFILVLGLTLVSCTKPQIGQTRVIGLEIPWQDSSSSHPKNAQLNALLDKYKMKGFPGISLLVRDGNGTWVGSRGKADIGNDIDFVPGTVSKAASITKLMMGTLVFRMMEDSSRTGMGYAALNKKVSEWLPPGIMNRLANGNLITLGQCMKHETGIPDIIEQDPFYLAVLNHPNKKWTPEELLEYVYDEDALFAAGDSAIYSNTNTVLVAMVLEAQSGRKHADLLKEYIITPLGMTNTYYQPHDALPNSVAQGYYDLYNNNTIVNVSNLVTGSGNGYGGIYSNLFDLQKFAEALFINETLLDPQSFSIMQTYGKQDGPNYYGYGLQKSFLNFGANFGIGHKGRDVGYTANLFHFPNKGVTHIFFLNYGTDGDSRLGDVFYEFQEELANVTLN